MRNVAVGEGAIALHKLFAEYQPDIVNRHLGLLMTTMNWTIRATDPITAINELDLRITAYELRSNERMADTVKRGVLLRGLGPLAEVQKHVMKDSARLNSYEHMRAEVVDLLRAETALHLPMDVDGACLSGPKGTGGMKDKGKGNTVKARASQRAKARQVKKSESVTSPSNLDICEVTALCTRNVLPREETKTRRTQLQCKERWSKRGSMLKRTTFSRLEKQ